MFFYLGKIISLAPSKFYVLLAEHYETFKKMETDLFRAYDNMASHIPLVTPVNGKLL